MLNVGAEQRIWLCVQPVDMRKSYDGLCALVRNHLGADPMDGHWYVFINRRRQQMKVLAFERGGFCLWCKRLEAGHFAFPSLWLRSSSSSGAPRCVLSAVEFLALLEGLDLVQTRRRKRFDLAMKKAA